MHALSISGAWGLCCGACVLMERAHLPSIALTTYIAYRPHSQLRGRISFFSFLTFSCFLAFSCFFGLLLIQRTLVRIKKGHVVGRWVRVDHSIDSWKRGESPSYLEVLSFSDDV